MLTPSVPPMEWGQGNPPAPMEDTNTATAQRELFIYWSYARAHPLPLTQAHLVQKRALRDVNEQLLRPELGGNGAHEETAFPHLHFMRLLLQELGLLIVRDNHVQATGPRNQVPPFWKQSVLERAQTCLRVWARMRTWNELASLRLSAFDLDLPTARGTLLKQLRLLPTLSWLSAERFLTRLHVVTPGLLFRSAGSNAPVGAEQAVTQGTQHNHRLAEIEAAFVGGALSGPLHWLGMLDIAADADRLLAFRINDSGACALGLEAGSWDAATGDAQLIVQPNFRMFALGPIGEGKLAILEMFAERISADASAFEYALSREAIYQAQQDGLQVSDIIAFLQQNASVPVPSNVLRTLQDWGEQHERITFHRAVSLCETDNAQLLDRLWHDSALRIHLERRLSPTLATVKPRRVAALREALLQRDVFPVHSPEGSPHTGLVRASAGGELQPIRRGPDLLLNACLRRLAEERDGRFQITQSAVTRALAAGMTIREYLRELAKIHHGPLPVDLEAQIKAWGHYYGEAYLREAVLLEVKDCDTADELLADPELSRMLSPFAADPDGKVLIVHSEDLAALRRTLRERGVQLL
jgi:hypothetical protein